MGCLPLDGELSSPMKTNHVKPLRLELLGPPTPALATRRRRQEPLWILISNLDQPYQPMGGVEGLFAVQSDEKSGFFSPPPALTRQGVAEVAGSFD